MYFDLYLCNQIPNSFMLKDNFIEMNIFPMKKHTPDAFVHNYTHLA